MAFNSTSDSNNKRRQGVVYLRKQGKKNTYFHSCNSSIITPPFIYLFFGANDRSFSIVKLLN